MPSNSALGGAASAGQGVRSPGVSPLTGGTFHDVLRERASLFSLEKERASVAALVRHHPGNPEIAADGRRRLKVLKAERLIRSLTCDEPVLTVEQRAQLAVALLSEPGGGDVHAA